MKTKSMTIKDNNLYIGSYKLSNLAKEYQTPLYIYDEVGIRDKIETFKKYFSSKKFTCEVVYASKAFIAPYLCDILKEYGFSIDAVSLGDLYILEKSGFPMNKVVLHGNCKSIEELKEAIIKEIEYIVVDNYAELSRLDELAKKYNKKVHTLFRVNPGIHADTHAYIETSLLSSKFGESIFDDGVLKIIAEKYKSSENVILDGFHAHIGSQINNPNSFSSEAKTMIEFVCKFEKEYNIKTSVLNLGGGFGIKYLDSDKSVDIPLMMEEIIKTVEESPLKINKLMIEPGRSIVGDSGVTLYDCYGKKTTYGHKKYLFVNGGMTDNIRPALYQAKYTVAVASRVESNEKEVYDVVGKCCESGDIVAENVEIGEVHFGDTICVFSTGAYCYSMSSNYNGAMRGAVLFINNDKITIAIKKERPEHMVETYNFNYEEEQKIFDMHSDMLYDLHYNNKDRLEKYHLKQLKSSVVKGAVWTLYSPDDFNLHEAVLDALDKIKLNDDFDFKIILGFESLRNLPKAEDILIYYDLGFRHAMLTWNEANIYATGVAGDKDRGLTEEGKKLIKIMMEKNMIIDLAHLNEKSFFDIIDVIGNNYSNVIYSHGDLRSICDHRRNITLEEMKALKKVNGILGLTLAGSFIDSKVDNRNLEHFLDHVDLALDIMGEDNVGFGFDFMDYLDEFTNSNIPEVPDATKAYRIIEGMRRRGHSERVIRKITWDNFYNRFKKYLYRK